MVTTGSSGGTMAACSCDAGFSTVDVLARPSCESETARTVCHAMGCLTSAVCFAVAVRQLRTIITATGSRSVGAAAGGSRDVAAVGPYTRRLIVRVVLSAAVVWSSSIFGFHVTGWRTRLSLQTPLFPLMMWSVAWGAVAGLFTLRLWLFTLPARLVQGTSIPTVIRTWADERHGTVVVAVVYWTWLSCVGVVGMFNASRWVDRVWFGQSTN